MEEVIKMKEKVIYIAEDGLEFENKADCILHESERQAEENIFKYVSFYNVHKEKIELDSFIKDCFIQRYINDKENFEFYSPIEDFLQDVFFIHVSKEIPNQKNELLIEEFMYKVCNHDLTMTRFDFERGITYYYDEDLEFFTNTIYERECIEDQIKFLTKIENFD